MCCMVGYARCGLRWDGLTGNIGSQRRSPRKGGGSGLNSWTTSEHLHAVGKLYDDTSRHFFEMIHIYHIEPNRRMCRCADDPILRINQLQMTVKAIAAPISIQHPNIKAKADANANANANSNAISPLPFPSGSDTEQDKDE